MDYEAWAEWYDLFHSLADAAETSFYVEQAKKSGGPVLEMGVGTGRIAIPTARAGIDVVGVDLYEPMIVRTKEKAAEGGKLRGKLELVQADMQDFDLGRVFPLVTIPGRSLLLLRSAAAMRRALKRAAAHLAPEGRLVLNVFNPSPELLADTSREPFLMGVAVDPRTGRRCRLLAVNRFDTLRQTNRGLQIVEELDAAGHVSARHRLEVRLRYLYASELHELLRTAGLRPIEVFGDFDGSPLREGSAEIVVVAQKAV